MSRSPQPDLRAMTVQSYRVVQTLWLVEAAVVAFLWLGIPLLTPRPAAKGGPAAAIAWIFFAVGLVDVALAWWVKQRALAGARQDGPAGRRLATIISASVVAVTLAMTPGILGLVLYLGVGNVGGQQVLNVMSLFALWLLRPRMEEWEEALRP